MAGRPPCTLFTTLALALFARSALAQVNVEALQSDLDAHPVYVAAQASFAGHIGNTNGVVGSAAAFAGATEGRHTAFIKLQGDYAEFSDTVSIAKAFGHARYDVRVLPFLYGEAFVQIEENKFQRLALRQVDGLGLRFGILQRREAAVFFGTAWMADYEKLSDDQLMPIPPPGATVPGQVTPPVPLTFVGPHWWAQRWSSYVAAGWKMNDRARLSDTAYIQPRVNAFSDFRFLNDASFVMDIDKRFSAKIDCQIHYNSTPPSRVLPTDVDTVTSLVFTL